MPMPAKRSDARHGHRSSADVEKLDVAALVAQEVEVPTVSTDWTYVATQMWDSFRRSAQTVYWEPSDWAMAWVLCDQLSRGTERQWINVGTIDEPEMEQHYVPMNGAQLNALVKGFGELLTTEGARRKVRLEIERSNGAQPAAPAAKVDVRKTRAGLLGVVDGGAA